MSNTNEIRKLIIKTIINKKTEKNSLDIHPIHFIELFDRELNRGIYILRDDSNRILNHKINGIWLIRRASIKGNKKIFPFIISYKYFNIYNHIFCYIENKGIIELDARYYNGGDQLPELYDNLKVKNSLYKDMFEIFDHYGLTFSYKVIKKLTKEIMESNTTLNI